MKKTHVSMIILTAILSILFAGCGPKLQVEVQDPKSALKMEGDPIENLALKESQWLDRVDAVYNDVEESFSQWNKGEITKEQFINQLNQHNTILKSIKQEYNDYIDANSLTEEMKSLQIYKDGLVYGKKMRSELNNFIFRATEGVIDAKTNELTPLTDDQIKKMHEYMLTDKYNSYKEKLEVCLDELKVNDEKESED